MWPPGYYGGVFEVLLLLLRNYYYPPPWILDATRMLLAPGR